MLPEEIEAVTQVVHLAACAEMADIWHSRGHTVACRLFISALQFTNGPVAELQIFSFVAFSFNSATYPVVSNCS